MSSVDRLVNLYHLLVQVLLLDVPGAVVELGCHAGHTSVLLHKVIARYAPDRALHVYDSFEGLPAPGPQDATLVEGDCYAPREAFEQTFERWDAPLPQIHEGWIQDTLPDHLPVQIAFAYLDLDFYASTLAALEQVYPRLAPGAVLCLDDYCDRAHSPLAWPGLPGIKRACDEFFDGRHEEVSVLVGSSDLAFGFIRRRRP